MTSTAADVEALLADGEPLTAQEIADRLSVDASFVARRQQAREVQKVLPELRRRGTIRRLIRQEVTRYVATASVAPVCLPCWRQKWSMTDEPPHETGFPHEICSLCRRPTNHGTYASVQEVEERRDPAPS